MNTIEIINGVKLENFIISIIDEKIICFYDNKMYDITTNIMIEMDKLDIIDSVSDISTFKLISNNENLFISFDINDGDKFGCNTIYCLGEFEIKIVDEVITINHIRTKISSKSKLSLQDDEIENNNFEHLCQDFTFMRHYVHKFTIYDFFKSEKHLMCISRSKNGDDVLCEIMDIEEIYLIDYKKIAFVNDNNELIISKINKLEENGEFTLDINSSGKYINSRSVYDNCPNLLCMVTPPKNINTKKSQEVKLSIINRNKVIIYSTNFMVESIRIPNDISYNIKIISNPNGTPYGFIVGLYDDYNEEYYNKIFEVDPQLSIKLVANDNNFAFNPKSLYKVLYNDKPLIVMV